MNYQRIAIYYSRSRTIVAPQGGGGGVYYDIEPILEVFSDDAFTKTLEEAIKLSNFETLQINLTRYKSPVLNAVGAKSYRKFCEVFGFCSLEKDDFGFHIQAWKRAPDHQGYDPDGSPIKLPSNTPIEQVAERILQIIRA